MESAPGFAAYEENASPPGSIAEDAELRMNQRHHSNDFCSPDEDSCYETDDTWDDTQSEGDSPEIRDLGSRSPMKRPSEETIETPPFKRQKDMLNREYLELLNLDIDEAAYRACSGDGFDLPTAQIGLTVWSALEKKQFFEALSRLGRHDLSEIAARIGTKSQAEVRHYLSLLEEARDSRNTIVRRSFLELGEYPAAVELSQQCCHALEDAADALSVRHQQMDELREMRKWGDSWEITPSVAQMLEQRAGESASETPMPFAHLFHLSNWLQLSEQVFMNSSVPGSNWNYIDERHPSIWATALDDFHSLAVSVTRRLVQTTLFIGMSRIRAKRKAVRCTKNVVRKDDVKAAVVSLGMPLHSHERWRTSARRLRLDVYEEPPVSDVESTDEEPMTYEEVEQALLQRHGSAGKVLIPDDIELMTRSHDDSDYGSDSGGDDEDNETDCDLDDAADMGFDSEARGQEEETDEEECRINQDVNEVLHYSSVNIRDSRSAKQALRLQVIKERHQEKQAEEHDKYASFQIEAEMWRILHKKPPTELPKMRDPGRMCRANLEVESVYPQGNNWASSLDYHEEWENIAC
ncbi:hypothetical protein UVI_02036530 [Ustilaginoidea virens]|nr:hypothetical protein UVI_02036530 [Ustilaginoidea virens]